MGLLNLLYPRRVPKDQSFGQTPYVMPPLRLMKGADGVDGGLRFKPLPGWWFTNSRNTTSYTTATASVADGAHLVPVEVEFDCTVDQIDLNVTTAIAASQIKAGIYRSNAARRPLTATVESAAVSSATTGIKGFALPSAVSLAKGELVWVSIRYSHAGIVLSAPQLYACTTIVHGPANFTQANKYIAKTGLTFGSAAPATWPHVETDFVATAAPLVGLRIAS